MKFRQVPKLSNTFWERYDFNDNDQTYFINSFEEIHWSDPFVPEPKHYHHHTSVDDLVYAESRYLADRSPVCIYIPKKSVMIKLMIACVGATKLDEIWKK